MAQFLCACIIDYVEEQANIIDWDYDDTFRAYWKEIKEIYDYAKSKEEMHKKFIYEPDDDEYVKTTLMMTRIVKIRSILWS